MATGTIKTVTDKGFGFITPDAGGGDKDLFFHNSEFSGDFNSLSAGMKVTYTDGMGDKGPKATAVSLAA